MGKLYKVTYKLMYGDRNKGEMLVCLFFNLMYIVEYIKTLYCNHHHQESAVCSCKPGAPPLIGPSDLQAASAPMSHYLILSQCVFPPLAQ